MDDLIKKLRQEAEEAKFLYNVGQIDREEAKRRIQPWLDEANKRAEKIAKKYGTKHRKFGFVGFVR